MEFGDNFAGVTAYYSLRRFTKGEDNNAIRVRRSSDDTEQDIGFDANGDLDTTALLAFVNVSYTNYQSDFSSTGQDDLNEANGTGAINQSVGGVDEAYLFTNTATGSCYPEVRNLLDVGQTTRIQLDYYIPSGQDCDMVILRGGSTEYTRGTTVGSWASIDITATVDRDDLFLFLGDGGSLSLGSTGNELYLKNIVVTQTTADGAVTTFYDQSGNGNDATNATSTEQPLVVSGGTLVTLDGYACLDGDMGADTMSQATNVIDSVGDVAIFSTYALKTDGTTANQITFEIGNGTSTHRIHDTLGRGGAGTFGIDIRGATNYDFGNATGVSVDDIYLNSILSETNGFYINGTQQTSNNAVRSGSTLDALTLFNRGGGAFPYKGKFFEFIFFDSDQSSNRTTMETNINDHFVIYP